ncbi:hypothetical protein PNOK_0559200 [Pyrrhoderma noxium]|uniref:Uncharacterized protein n=1 Tax=Pyrrhoderma noxium TaxID=2282107 RepID=A0A286UGU9_9AGAM|nr:hypothetical protein PNOK_0559200 [Pyrrhoderma noxium]
MVWGMRQMRRRRRRKSGDATIHTHAHNVQCTSFFPLMIKANSSPADLSQFLGEEWWWKDKKARVELPVQ